MGANNLTKSVIIGFSVLYAVIVLSDMVCSSFPSLVSYRVITKPAIMMVLLLFFYKYRSYDDLYATRLMILALLFSLAGDVLLLFTGRSELFFILGLVSFLMAHLMYVFVFLKKRNPKRRGVAFLCISLIYGAILFYILHPGLGEMKIPVLLYMLVILAMANVANLRKDMVTENSYQLVFIGAVSFMISDSILAFEKFHTSIPLSNIWIMATYAFAQLLIVFGVLQQKKKV